MTRLKKYKFSDFVNINPLVKLKANEQHSFIEMKDLNDGQRYTYPSIQRTLTGGARFEEGDTLFARITPCLENGKICQAKGLKDAKGFGSTEFLVFRGKEGISDPNFVFYLSRWDEVRRFAELNLVGTSGRQRVPKDVFENLELDLPEDLPTQTLIASILSSLDDKIELNRRTNQTLEQIAQTLFKKYFVDDIDPENLPEGWRWGKLGEVCENFDSRRIPLSSMQRDKRKGVYPYYGAASLMGFVDDYIFEGLHILLGEDGSVIDQRGFPILQYVWGKFWVNNHAHVLKGKSYFTTNHLYMILLNTSVAHLVTGAVQPKINQGNLNNLEVLIPNEKACLKFSKEIDSLFELKKNNIDEIKNLEIIRDSLLPKLMSGEIEVNAIENELVEA